VSDFFPLPFKKKPVYPCRRGEDNDRCHFGGIIGNCESKREEKNKKGKRKNGKISAKGKNKG
jgi:hypothetical protein